MNLRETKVNLKEPFTDSSITNIYNSDGRKTAYLTFDDGPSAETTPGILKILDSYNIKATFFIVGNMAIINPDLVKKEAQYGQAIRNHTYSHDYKRLYSNANTFISDVNKCDTVLKSILGIILMHDASDKERTVQALPQVIEYLKSQGYSFNTLK